MEFLIISHTFPIRLHHSLLPNVVRKPHASESTIKKTKCPAGRHLNLHRSALDSQPVTSLVSVVGGFKLPRPKKKQEKEGSNKLDVIWLKLDTFSNCTLKKDRKDFSISQMSHSRKCWKQLQDVLPHLWRSSPANFTKKTSSCPCFVWLVVLTILKNMKVNGKDYPIYYGK